MSSLKNRAFPDTSSLPSRGRPTADVAHFQGWPNCGRRVRVEMTQVLCRKGVPELAGSKNRPNRPKVRYNQGALLMPPTVPAMANVSATLPHRRWLLLGAYALLAAVVATLFLSASLFALAWYHLQAGKSALDRYHTEEAQHHLDQYLHIWPKSAQAHLLAARAARRAGDLELAQEHLRLCDDLHAGAWLERVFEWALLRAAMGDL